MMDGKNYRSHYPFTASQWQELEQQTLIFRYLVSEVPVPPALISTVTTTPLSTISSSSSSSSLFPQQQPLPSGWGSFQVGFGRKIDPEPGRCRRTDGKKWRCSKEAYPDSKYCERHMHRGKNKAKKSFEVFTTTKSTTHTIPSNSTPTMNPCFVSHKNQLQPYQTTSTHPFPSHQFSNSSLSNQNNNAMHWLLDHELHDQPKKDTRYFHEMQRGSDTILGSQASRIKISSSTECYDFQEQKEARFTVDKKDETQKTFHHFLGDWRMKSSDSWVDYDSNRTYKSTPISSQASHESNVPMTDFSNSLD